MNELMNDQTLLFHMISFWLSNKKPAPLDTWWVGSSNQLSEYLDLAEFRGEHGTRTKSNRAPFQRLIGVLTERARLFFSESLDYKAPVSQ